MSASPSAASPSISASAGPSGGSSSQQQPRILSNREADTLMKQQKAKGLKECRAQMEQFVECSRTRTLSIFWACREQKKALSDCLRVYTSEEALEQEKQNFLQNARSQDGRSV